MDRSFLEAWFLLLYFDCLMRLRNFESIHSIVGKQRVNANEVRSEGVEVLCRAIDRACVFYFRRVLCLQRSAATAVLLRRHGWVAELVIGVQLLPFQSHAWVEVGGVVVNDKPYVAEKFQVLERC